MPGNYNTPEGKTMNQPDCTHKSFACEQVDAAGSNIKIGIVRCTQCGKAIGTLYPQVPNVLNAIGEKLDAVLKRL
jgi:transcription elongation factor Elf1